jgi:hypothetical protein
VVDLFKNSPARSVADTVKQIPTVKLQNLTAHAGAGFIAKAVAYP